MPNFIIAYRGSEKTEIPEDGTKQFERWQAWVAGLGDAVVNPGTPLAHSKTVSSEGVADETGSHRLTGFTTVTAETMDAALDMARACPFLEVGTIEVAQIMEMS